MPRVPHPFHAPFPVDIEEHIIDQLVDHVASLRNCSLTCRAWLPRSRYHLFRTIRISTRSIWDAAVDYFRETPRVRSLVRSLATAPVPTERTRLLGTYPVVLFQMLPRLRRWEIRAPVDVALPKNDTQRVSFHPTTLIQLRCSPITELHLSSIQFTSNAEFVRFISSIRLLRVLECTDVDFGVTNGILFRRRPLGLSSLQVCHGKENDDIVPWLLDASQSSLQNLVLRGQKDALVKWQPASDTPVVSKLVSLTLHADQQPYDGTDSLYLEALRDALGCMQILRCGGALERLEIHLYARNPSLSSNHPQSMRRVPCNDPVSLALFLSEDRMRDCCQTLEQALLADRATHLTIVTHLPSFWTHREIVLRGLREDAFPNLHSKGLLNVGYSGGNANACQSCTFHTFHNGPVSALAVSPDGRWIASASPNLAMLWDASSRRLIPVREWVNPIQNPSTMSIAFSPDSDRLACCGHIKGRRPFVQILPTDEGSRLARLEGPELGDDDTLSQLACAWHPDRLVFVCLARATVSVRIWDGGTFDQQLGWQGTSPIYDGSLLLSGNGRMLAVAGIHDPWEVTARRRSRGTTQVGADDPLCVLWDLGRDTGGLPHQVLRARSSHWQDRPLAASFDHGGERLVASFADHTIRVWSVATGETLLSATEPVPVEFQPHYNLYTPLASNVPITKAVAFSPDGRYLLSLRYMRIDDDRMETLAILWDSRSGSGQPLLGWEDTRTSGVGGNPGFALFNAAGTRVAFTANDGRAQVFDLPHEVPVTTHWVPEDVSTQSGLFSPRGLGASSLVISPDGQTLCCGTWRGEVEIFSL